MPLTPKYSSILVCNSSIASRARDACSSLIASMTKTASLVWFFGLHVSLNSDKAHRGHQNKSFHQLRQEYHFQPLVERRIHSLELSQDISHQQSQLNSFPHKELRKKVKRYSRYLPKDLLDYILFLDSHALIKLQQKNEHLFWF